MTILNAYINNCKLTKFHIFKHKLIFKRIFVKFKHVIYLTEILQYTLNLI
jgi:hypothetical protein